LQVTQNGLVSTLPGFRHFPDTKADVIGKKIQVSYAQHSTLLLSVLQPRPFDAKCRCDVCGTELQGVSFA
jgi:Phospholipase D C terminal